MHGSRWYQASPEFRLRLSPCKVFTLNINSCRHCTRFTILLLLLVVVFEYSLTRVGNYLSVEVPRDFCQCRVGDENTVDGELLAADDCDGQRTDLDRRQLNDDDRHSFVVDKTSVVLDMARDVT